ncbi:hypothetical protein CPC08DRAFT_725663 [Agrocybe pediades]|nr:hypothetical protein CPC08DRAFT_725663 [Agrocybe pediades]
MCIWSARLINQEFLSSRPNFTSLLHEARETLGGCKVCCLPSLDGIKQPGDRIHATTSPHSLSSTTLAWTVVGIPDELRMLDLDERFLICSNFGATFLSMLSQVLSVAVRSELGGWGMDSWEIGTASLLLCHLTVLMIASATRDKDCEIPPWLRAATAYESG